jgi:ACR3 family arsenite efflux pump ArsB
MAVNFHGASIILLTFICSINCSNQVHITFRAIAIVMAVFGKNSDEAFATVIDLLV